MAKVIIVAPPVRLDVPMMGSGHTKTYPVHINPGPLTADSPPNMLSMTASVTIPDPETYTHIVDPMKGHLEWAGFGRSHFGKRGTHRVKPSVLLTSVMADEMVNRFWDSHDFEAWVAATCEGDILVQHDDFAQRWNFGCLNNHDYYKLTQRLGQAKAASHKVDARLHEKVLAWLEEHATEFDYVTYTSWGANSLKPPSIYYVRDAVEELHFKMRWIGIDVDAELEHAEPAQA